MPDNGIKLFSAGGHKLDDALEDAIEARLHQPEERPTGARIGRVRDLPDAADRYLHHLALAGTEGVPLSGLRVVVDCANGAAAALAPRAYRAAGADVVELSASPDGWNINEGCGSTHLEPVRAAVVEHRADLGIAHDGDADRCLAVTADGAVVDGDQIMAVLALAMHERGELTHNTLVATVMSNLGLHLAMRAAGVDVRTTSVGDRYVLEELRSGGYALGGEQSGHLVLPAHATTGDGLLTALRLMARMAATGRSLADLAGVLEPLPQVLVNVPVVDKALVAESSAVQAAVAQVEAELDGRGRVLLRPSGTEQLVRVMVEAPTTPLADQLAARIAAVVASSR
jgi:phosphoglucosamine mutase